MGIAEWVTVARGLGCCKVAVMIAVVWPFEAFDCPECGR
jgi:hypothetical protein